MSNDVIVISSDEECPNLGQCQKRRKILAKAVQPSGYGLPPQPSSHKKIIIVDDDADDPDDPDEISDFSTVDDLDYDSDVQIEEAAGSLININDEIVDVEKLDNIENIDIDILPPINSEQNHNFESVNQNGNILERAYTDAIDDFDTSVLSPGNSIENGNQPNDDLDKCPEDVFDEELEEFEEEDKVVDENMAVVEKMLKNNAEIEIIPVPARISDEVVADTLPNFVKEDLLTQPWENETQTPLISAKKKAEASAHDRKYPKMKIATPATKRLTFSNVMCDFLGLPKRGILKPPHNEASTSSAMVHPNMRRRSSDSSATVHSNMRRRSSDSGVHDITEQIKALIIQHGTLVINKSAYADGDSNEHIDITQDDYQYFVRLTTTSNMQKDQTISTTVLDDGHRDDSSCCMEMHHTEASTSNNNSAHQITSTQMSSRSPKRLGKLIYTPQQRIRMLTNKGIALRLRRRRIKRIKDARKKHNKLKTKVATRTLLTQHPDCKSTTPNNVNMDKRMIFACVNMQFNEEWSKPRQPREIFVQMLIGDLLTANWKGCMFYSRRYINIVGTIVGIYTNITEKIQLIVDDSTGRITCVVEPPYCKRRNRLNRYTEKREEERENVEPALEKQDLVKIYKEVDWKIVQEGQRNAKFNGDLQDAYSYIMLQKAKNLSKEYPQKKDLSLSGEAFGQHVSVTGKVYDWSEQRVIYAWNVKFISMDEFFIQLGKLNQP